MSQNQPIKKIKKVKRPHKGHDGRSKEHLKPVFLEHFKKIGTIRGTANAVGIDRQTIQRWRQNDEAFEAAFIEADSDVTDVIEHRAIEMATKRDHHNHKTTCEKCSHKQTVKIPCELGADVAMTIFLLKSRNPRYRPTTTINISFVQEFVSLVSKAVNETLPNYCPHCTQTLDIRPTLMKKLESMKRISV